MRIIHAAKVRDQKPGNIGPFEKLKAINKSVIYVRDDSDNNNNNI